MFESNQGWHGKEIRSKNVEAIKKWLEKNPSGSVSSCSRDTGISRTTIYKINKDAKEAKKAKENK